MHEAAAAAAAQASRGSLLVWLRHTRRASWRVHVCARGSGAAGEKAGRSWRVAEGGVPSLVHHVHPRFICLIPLPITGGTSGKIAKDDTASAHPQRPPGSPAWLHVHVYGLFFISSILQKNCILHFSHDIDPRKTSSISYIALLALRIQDAVY